MLFHRLYRWTLTTPIALRFDQHKGGLSRGGEDRCASVRRPGIHLEALRNEDTNVRWEVARALGVTRDPRAVEPLISALGDRDPDVRRKAALSLAKIRDLRAVEPLLACSVKDENQVVRWAAAWGLGKFPDRKIA